MMNQIVRRIFAGVSAVILSVSAIGSDTLIGNFRQTLHADSDEPVLKQGSTTGFDSLEQDTIIDKSGNKIYNTNYGLHTDKTVSKAYSDGRTFDLDLESWYIGEKPVDVGLVLDASGSMAWTTDTLYPLEVNLGSITYKGETMSLEKLKKIQDDNGGYLPQDVVDLILNPDNTDNTKLGYSDYKYYVYEDRSAVSEFVPLGYWDGGSPLIDESLIGYYPFNGNLNNEAPNAGADAKGSYIAQPTAGIFDSEAKATTTPQAVFSGGYLDLSETDKNGNIVIDLSDLDYKKSLDIKFTLNCGNIDAKCAPQSPILYLGDGTNQQYLALMRGRSHEAGSGASKNIYVYQGNGSDGTQLDALREDGTQIPKGESYTNDNSVITNDTDLNCEWKIEYNSDTNEYDITLIVGTNKFIYHSGKDYFTSLEKLYLIIGGDEILPKGSLKGNKTEDNVIDPEKLKGDADKNISIKNLQISGIATDGTEFSDTVALDSISGLKGTNLTAEYTQQSAIGSTNLSFDAQTGVDAEVQYADEDNALNLTQTAKYGAILLDKAPEDSSFTLSFKVKKAGIDDEPKPESNILYMGKMDTSKEYYRIFRDAGRSSNRLKMQKKDENTTNRVNINSVFGNTDYKEITIVFNGTTITQYMNGVIQNTENSSPKDLDSPIDTEDLSLLLGGLFDSSYSGADIYIDDFYIFDNALTEKQVNYYFGDGNTNKSCNVSDAAHAITADGTEIAQIAVSSDKDKDKGNYNRKRLADNPNHEDRRGWYYVNSHSNWEDIDGCLASGKQYIGILNELPKTADGGNVKGEVVYDHSDTATIPSAYAEDSKERESITAGNTGVIKYEAPPTERSIRFYVDDQNHLRCFVWSGSDSTYETEKINGKTVPKKGDDGKPIVKEERTFCSLVYVNPEKDETGHSELKYQTLNTALNTFFTELHKKSSFSNVSAVRFSLEALVDKKEEELEKLKMLNWVQPTEKTLPKGLISPRYPEENSNSAENSGDGQYNYVMTGGTYTWTGLRSFYENLRNDEKVRDNGRPKYLIIFTDGRDNLADTNSNHKYTHKKDASNKLYENSIGNFAPCTDDEKPETQLNLSDDSQLAGAWAKKLKDAGYTIYCVMLATGSISPTANEDEYNRAANFLATLAGNSETSITGQEDKNFDKYVFISDPSVNDEKSSLKYKFQEVLNNMSSSLSTYTVQDYIDPRFDLVDRDGNILKLGAGGKITGESLTEPKTVTDEIGFEYTPKDTSYGGGEVNKTGDITATIYYNSEKDMYYLRWTVKSIGGGSKPFTTGDEKDAQQYLNESSPEQEGIWHSTITIKAKDDFIGGNAILTNGNEAGMNLVYSTNALDSGTKLEDLSGTNNSVDREGDTPLDISPSKGFPKVVTCVRLLNITTKPLNEVIYLGEVVSPTYMLSELEDGYMEGSYYLEYLKRYAYRLYPDGTETPLLELLNQWLKIDDSGVKNKTFTIPYIYLPDPQYNEDGTLLKEKGKVVVNNNSGTPKLNQKDIVGFLTYTWKRLDPDTGYIYDSDDDIMLEFVAEDTKQIVYNLELKFTPLHEEKDKFSISLNSNEFIEDEKEEFFNATGDEFTKAEGWTFGTRDDYLKALVNDSAYEWNLEYKPTAGTPQVEDSRKYGDAEVKGGSLFANTTYTKDVVNAGLALEMIVKGEDLDGSTTVVENGKFEFTAIRNYTDALDPVYYKPKTDPKYNIGANADNEKYTLTFTIQGVPSDIDPDSTYTIWAKLTDVKKFDSTGKEIIPYPYPENSLPIGTYTIIANLETEDQFIVKETDHFKNFNADNNRGNFIPKYFPENVCNVSSDAVKDTGDDEYLIENEKNPYSAMANIAKNKKVDNSLTFYFGTKLNGITKGESVKDKPETTDDYAKDRLGIIMLSYGSNRLAISKEVTSKNIAVIKEQAVLDNFWNFDITLTLKEGIEKLDTTEYSLKWLDLETGNELADADIPKIGGSSVTSLKFEEDSTVTDGLTHYKAQISVKSNTQVILEQLPNDVSYTVSEVRTNQTKEHDFQDRYRYDILVEGEGATSDKDKGTSSGELSPASSVNFINQFPSPELPSTGGNGGIDITLYCDIMLVVAAGLYLTILFCKKCRKRHEREG